MLVGQVDGHLLNSGATPLATLQRNEYQVQQAGKVVQQAGKVVQQAPCSRQVHHGAPGAAGR